MKRLTQFSADERLRRQALARFEGYLDTDPPESEWQQLFDANPFLLTDTLPLRCDCICSQVPLVSGRPDYVFWRGDSLGGDIGVIELKRSGQPILGTYSSRFVYPSKHLSAAVQQTSAYLDNIRTGMLVDVNGMVIAGNRRHAFIIIGQSEELKLKCRTEVLRAQLRTLLPAGFDLYTYTELRDLFAATIQPRLHILVADDGYFVEDCGHCGIAVRVPDRAMRQFKATRQGLIGGDGYWISMFGNVFCSADCNVKYTED